MLWEYSVALFQLQNNTNKKLNTEKKWGISLVVVSCVCFLFLFTNLLPFVKSFLLGVFGLFAYPMFITLFVIGIALINNKKYVMTTKYLVYLSCCLIFLLAILQLIIVGKPNVGFFEYLGLCYTNQLTAGGILIGLVTAPVIFVLDLLGGYILFSLGLIVFVALVVDYLVYVKNNASLSKPTPYQRTKSVTIQPQVVETVKNEAIKEKSVLEPEIEKVEKPEVKIVLDAEIEKMEKENQARYILGLDKSKPLPQISTPKEQTKRPENLYEYIMTPPKTVDMSIYNRNRENKTKEMNYALNEIKNEIKQEQTQLETPSNEEIKPSKIVHDDMPTFVNSNPANNAFIEEEQSKQSNEDDYADEILKDLLNKTKKIDINPEPIAPQISRRRGFAQMELEGVNPPPVEKSTKKTYSKPPTYTRPPLDIFRTVSVDLSTLNEDVVGKRMQLENALDMFHIPAKVIGVVVGPSVTRYELEMPPGISVKKILAHSDDIALALAAKGDIRIEAPIPGKSAVGVEVPNEQIATVSMREILESPEFINAKSPLTFALGKDIAGSVKVCNLQKMPHLIVAGATNSGKSVCLNAIIISLIYKTSPDDVKLILVDPKRVEFSMYNQIPHLLIPNVITESDKAINAFSWAVNEMERRYNIFSEDKVRNLDEYNMLEGVKSGEKEKLPFIVIIVDEMADLMMTAKKEAEEKIMRLAQKARAAGIHLILATQRPSVDVITGTIKANFPSRIAFSVTSFQDSRTILDQGGAEKLLGKGDMLYAPCDAAEPRRIQGCFVSGKEVEDIVEFVKQNNEVDFDSQIEIDMNTPQNKSGSTAEGVGHDDGFDSLMPEALKLVIENGQASISLIQRRLVVGYPRAARIIDQMERANFISGSDGSKPRTVYITMEKYEELFGNK